MSADEISMKCQAPLNVSSKFQSGHAGLRDAHSGGYGRAHTGWGVDAIIEPVVGIATKFLAETSDPAEQRGGDREVAPELSLRRDGGLVPAFRAMRSQPIVALRR
ncbi:hypothetical protein [Amycolatopsis sp. cmx-11-51]|uniref:hypothetical protein n=1 Tax=Amycolatopsis sp. cmx-11-51 TaxID=2785797 RepID=UPI0039E3595E